MVDGVPRAAHGVTGSASNQGVLSGQSLPLTMLGFKQALTSLNLVPNDPLRCYDSIQEVTTQCYQDSTMIIKEDFAFIIQEYAARAAMARPSETGPMVTQLTDTGVSRA